MSDTFATDKVQALLNPKNVVIMGATDKPGNWAQRVWRNLNRFGFPGPIYPMNPSRDMVWETKCYRTLAALPEAPDHLVLLIPSAQVPDALLEAKRLGARSATVMAAGFGESTDPAGKALGKRLKEVIEQTGLAISGPNCLGNVSAAARMMTAPEDRPQRFVDGPVAIVGQSGGVAMTVKLTLEERGIDTGVVVTSGNETGLTTADYISYFATMPNVRVIFSYLEAITDPQKFLAACRKARDAGRPVVVMKLGASPRGREAAMGHTGALAGSMEAFDAVAGDALRVPNVDSAIEVIEYLARCNPPKSKRIAGLTYSGAMRGLLLDSATAHGLDFVELADDTKASLQTVLSVGTRIGNPLDAGFAALTSENALAHCVGALLADPNVDALVIQGELPRAPLPPRMESSFKFVSELAAGSSKPIVYLSMASHSTNEHALSMRRSMPHVPFFQEIDKTMRSLSAIIDYGERQRTSDTKPKADARARQTLNEILKNAKGAALTEVESKKLIEAYGISSPREIVATSPEAAAEAAKDIGFPVVAKLVSSTLTHKSDVGGVILNLRTEEDVRKAFQEIAGKIRAHPGNHDFQGVLIAEQVSGGREVMLGANLDAEVGPVILFGSGGVEVELYKDVAISAPVFDEASAKSLIMRTRAGVAINSYRGSVALDIQAAARALIGLSELMSDSEGRITSVDINPFLLQQNRGTALDALIVLREPQS